MLRPHSWRRVVVVFGATLVLAAVFCRWVYHAKVHRDLNRRLLVAVRKGEADVSQQLLAGGADPNLRDAREEPLHLWQQIKLAFHPDSENSDVETPTLLEMAMNHDECEDCRSDTENIPLIRALLDAGANVDVKSYDGGLSAGYYTPLIWAVVRNQPKTVRLLLDHGANSMAKEDGGGLPIHFVLDSSLCDLLLKRGNDINAVDNEGRTPLMNAIQASPFDNAGLLRYLIVRGANVNARAQDGTSPLLMATTEGDGKAVLLLLAHGAEVNICDETGQTPLHAAASCDKPFDHIKSLADQGISFDPIDNVKTLLDHGAKVDPLNKNRDTPLTNCLKEASSPDIVKLLIQHGADVDHRNKVGQTALSIAKKSKYAAILKLLLAAGARR